MLSVAGCVVLQITSVGVGSMCSGETDRFLCLERLSYKSWLESDIRNFAGVVSRNFQDSKELEVDALGTDNGELFHLVRLDTSMEYMFYK